MTIAIYVFCAVLLLTLVFLLIFAKSVLKVGFGKRCEGNPLLHYFTADDFDGLKAEPVEFQNNHINILSLYEKCADRIYVLIYHAHHSNHTYYRQYDFFCPK